jgi:hypothetical protein
VGKNADLTPAELRFRLLAEVADFLARYRE